MNNAQRSYRGPVILDWARPYISVLRTRLGETVVEIHRPIPDTGDRVRARLFQMGGDPA